MQENVMMNGQEKELTVKSYLELKLEVMKAFDEDKCESNWLSISTPISSCSSSTKTGVDINVSKRKSTSSICLRFTQPMDYKDTTNAMTGGISMSPMVLADDVVMRLLLLENRGKILLSKSYNFQLRYIGGECCQTNLWSFFKYDHDKKCAFSLFLDGMLVREVAMG